MADHDDFARFDEAKDRLLAATGLPGLTTFSGGEVHMALSEWERLIGFAERSPVTGPWAPLLGAPWFPKKRRSDGPLDQAQCPDGPHRGPQGPNEDLGQCSQCWSPSYAMRPTDEQIGLHADDCALPISHESYCVGGGSGHAPLPVVRGFWSGMDQDIEDAHARHAPVNAPPASAPEAPAPTTGVQNAIAAAAARYEEGLTDSTEVVLADIESPDKLADDVATACAQREL